MNDIKKDFDYEKRVAINTAKELRYGKEFIERLKSATNSIQLENTMIAARRATTEGGF